MWLQGQLLYLAPLEVINHRPFLQGVCDTTWQSASRNLTIECLDPEYNELLGLSAYIAYK